MCINFLLEKNKKFTRSVVICDLYLPQTQIEIYVRNNTHLNTEKSFGFILHPFFLSIFEYLCTKCSRALTYLNVAQ